MSNRIDHKGAFVISLDYELLWGVWDVTTKEKYGAHIRGVKEVIPALLKAFENYNIKATFATVGILFSENKDVLKGFIPEKKPGYGNPNYNVYLNEFATIGNNETDDPYHFGYSLFEMIRQSPHEVATHTFSHYFCLEEGQNAEEFDADIKAAVKIAEEKSIQLCSLVFPRNQINELYLPVLAKNGIKVYRGNPESWIYKPRKFSAEVPFIRLCRLLDTYFSVSGYNTFSVVKDAGLPVNVPASRFLKPYNKNLAWLEKLKLKRIMNEMTYAAKNSELYHLWWHPHNFGVNLNENMENLVTLLKHYQFLQTEYGFCNLTMKEAAGL
jgi:peptidoglycan/xylan/chitin deacetylase (PgdA/CDA1 family)